MTFGLSEVQENGKCCRMIVHSSNTIYMMHGEVQLTAKYLQPALHSLAGSNCLRLACVRLTSASARQQSYNAPVPVFLSPCLRYTGVKVLFPILRTSQYLLSRESNSCA